MKNFKEKSPIVFEIILFIIGLLLAGVIMNVVSLSGCDSATANSIARILIAFVFLAIFHKCFKFGSSFKGLVPMLPALLFAIYKIPYHFISGGGSIIAITVPVLLIGFAPAIFEEVLFRGIFISNLKKKYDKPVTIVLISAVVFSLVHLTNIVGMSMATVLVQTFLAFAVGIVLGAVYLYTKDIVSVIIAHFLIDVVSGIFPGGEATPYYFLAIFVAICCFEIIYGLLLVRKITSSTEQKR
ncbi:MAG: CPBP family intramembrane metalloprotease [Lachnospiraceae bacterium]|nr:CPBP family intramembrane metalloprotease [Lachnospiraceae bacterium]